VILVYSVKNYCILKINDKGEIRYILFQKRKECERVLKVAKKVCDVYGYDAVRVAQSWFKRFQFGTLMSKMHLALVKQPLEKWMKL